MAPKPHDGAPVSLAARRAIRQATPVASAPPVETLADAPAQADEQPGELMDFRLVLVFSVDGQPVAHLPLATQAPKPSDGQAVQLQLGLDARQLMQWLEPVLGPGKPHLWTPGG